jgi:hypothetical protein
MIPTLFAELSASIISTAAETMETESESRRVGEFQRPVDEVSNITAEKGLDAATSGRAQRTSKAKQREGARARNWIVTGQLTFQCNLWQRLECHFNTF